MDKKYISYILIILTFILSLSYLAIAKLIQPNQQVSQSELYQIEQIAEYCQALCIYAKENLSISNLSYACLSSKETITGANYWYYPNWGCSVDYTPQCYYGINNYVILDENCSIEEIYYHGSLLNI